MTETITGEPANSPHPLSRARAEQHDRDDPLALMRRRFDLPGGLIYLDGNSLGALPRGVAARLGEVTRHEWGDKLIAGWWQGWMDLPRQTGARIAPLIGADPDHVVACDSTSLNLYKLAAAALLARPDRSVILSDADNFPTDLYMFEGLSTLMGKAVELRTVPRAAIMDHLTTDVALLSLSHVDYRTAEQWDMAALTHAAHKVGALSLWDLSHSAGAVAVDLAGAQADMAVGCGYKFLNGGPGAPAYLYVAPDLCNTLVNPLSGWMGHQAPFDFAPRYQPAEGIDRFACGTPPVLGLAALDRALEVFADVDLPALYAKGQALCALFLALTKDLPGICALSPTKDIPRGCHVALSHRQAKTIMAQLASRGVVGDFRPPDVMRFGFSALYCRYVDVWDAAHALALEIGKSEDGLSDNQAHPSPPHPAP
ncbi:kynureninase [Iodidimonas gelatinilytica]|uniref:Kynureninase n=1 Tax=Iodidimonas gelatinilytica TaxID=1236966 RepID=A0A5A7MR10_9PROT|nr:aminotransferase class V-fold PLP-dependent enzyme [Iodidimonas gelatinilytica]GEQ98054.1 kynureninase [Iodidimonas gelatinilytica]